MIQPEVVYKQQDHYPLKLKYLVMKYFKYGIYKGRTGNCYMPTPKRREAVRPRKRAYGPF